MLVARVLTSTVRLGNSGSTTGNSRPTTGLRAERLTRLTKQDTARSAYRLHLACNTTVRRYHRSQAIPFGSKQRALFTNGHRKSLGSWNWLRSLQPHNYSKYAPQQSHLFIYQYNAFCGRRTSERDSEPCTCEIAPGYLQ